MCMIHFKEMWLCSSNTDVISFCLHSSYSSIASVALIFIKPQPLKRGIYVMTMSICLFVCSSIAWNNAATMADIPSQRHLRSATRHHLTVPHYRLCTFGRQAFSVAGPTVWNSLPDSLRDMALSSNNFRQSLKMNLFQRCYSAHTALWRCLMTLHYINLLLTMTLTLTILLLLVCVSWTITGQPQNRVFIRRV